MSAVDEERRGLGAVLKYVPRVFHYMRPYRLLMVLAVAFTIVSALVALAHPWPLAFLVDSALGSREPSAFVRNLVGDNPVNRIVFAVAAGLALTIVANGVSILSSAVQVRLEQRMIFDLRSDLFAHVQRLSLAFHDSARTGGLMFAVNSQAAAVGEIGVIFLPLAENVLTVVGMGVIAYRLDPTLALLALTVVPAVYFSTQLYAKHIDPRLREVRELEGTSLSIVYEALAMMRVIVAFGRERHEHRKFAIQGREAVNARIDLTVRQTSFALAVNVLTAAGTALVIGYGAYLVLGGKLTVGELLVIVAYIGAVYRPLEEISGTAAALQTHLISLEAAVQLLDAGVEVESPPDGVVVDRARGHLEMRGVDYNYSGRVDTLKEISFDAPAGEVLAIVGPTGAGKSTLVSLIPRFFDPKRGEILLDGVDIREISLPSLREQISIVLQEPLLFSGSIADNIRYGRLEATDAEIVEAAKAANAHDFIERLPGKYEALLGERGARLSGGERQRIAVARAFLKDAPILLLDEPTSSVDSKTESVILEALSRLMMGRTTVMIAHRLSTIRHAKQILVVDQGRIVARGTHQELVRAGGLYQEMYDAQNAQAAQSDVVDAAEPAPRRALLPALTPAAELPNPAPVAKSDPISVPVERLALDSAAQPVDPPQPGPAPKLLRPALTTKPKIVVLGMLTKMPVAGVAWQTLHYLLGFQRLGYDVYYVEAHARTPSMLMRSEDDDSSRLAADHLGALLPRFGFAGRWAFHALHADGRVHGMTRAGLLRLYREAAFIVNLHGGTQPLPEHSDTGRLVYLETDPVQLQIELHDGLQSSVEFLAAHAAFFTFAENLGRPDCQLPGSPQFDFHPTRQPVVMDEWPRRDVTRPAFTTIGNWRQEWRPVRLNGETYTWSKHTEFGKIIDLPARTGAEFELALSSATADDEQLLRRHGWQVRAGLGVTMGIDDYRDYISCSRGEFTVAKDQNVRLRTGWFSDRSATYLAAGRPVITQQTGFSNVLPTGEGLFGFSTLDDAAEAVAAVVGNYQRHCAAAREIAREHFDSDVVLGRLLSDLGETPLGRHRPPRRESVGPLPPELVLTPVSKRPTVLPPTTVAAVLNAAPPPSPASAESDESVNASVIIVSFDNLVFTRMCLETVLASTAADCELIVVDNGSTDGSADYLEDLAERFTRVRCVFNPDNRGFPAAANQGLSAASGEFLVLLNNDTIVSGDWLESLTRKLADPGVGLVGPVTGAAPNEARRDPDYTTYGEFVAHARQIAEAGTAPFDIDVATLFCAAMRRSTYLAVGGLDERFGLGLFEDDDYAARIRQAGLRVVCAPDVFVHHFGEASFGKLAASGDYDELLRANRRRFEAKWGTPWSPHRRTNDEAYAALVRSIHEQVEHHVPPEASVVVVSKGDDSLFADDGRHYLHFPADEHGEYSGYYPADDHEAIQQLRTAQHRDDARYLVIPQTSRWWLEHYTGFREHLADFYDEVVNDETCLILSRRTETGRLMRNA